MSVEQQPTKIGSNPDIELRRSDNPYKVKIDDPLSEDETLERQLRYVLNRLTPQNFQKLVINLLNLPINTEERLRQVVDIVFDNALSEETYSFIYARACKLLAETKVPFQHVSTRFISFLTMLLKKCEHEFDSNFHKDKYYEYLIKEAESYANETKKKELYKLANEQLEKAKRNYIGNVKFLGELFNLDLLEENIIYECIEKLLSQETDQDYIECLCKLLTTIGKKLDKSSATTIKLDVYFDRLKVICEKLDLISPRIRFMILNLFDLRKNNWIPRHENAPRRIDEIRREFEKEEEIRTSELNLPPSQSLSRVEFGMCEGLKYSLFYSYAHHILDEFFKDKNLEHVLKDLNQLKLIQHNELIESMITIVLDRTDNERESLGELFYTALKHDKLDKNQFVEGLKKVMITAIEMSIEGPAILTQLSQIIACLFNPDYINIKFLKDAFGPEINQKVSAKLMCETIKLAAKRVTKQTVLDIIELSDLDLNCFFVCFEDEKAKSEFIKENQIDWAFDKSIHQEKVLEHFELYKNKLNNILDNAFLENDSILNKIENQFEKKELESKEFIRALSFSIVTTSMVHKKVEVSRLKKRVKILEKFISQNEDFQLEVLYTIQILDFQLRYQPDFIKTIFSILNDEDIIQEEIFWKWKKNARGRGHAISEFILKGFFEWLSNAKHED